MSHSQVQTLNHLQWIRERLLRSFNEFFHMTEVQPYVALLHKWNHPNKLVSLFASYSPRFFRLICR